MENESRTLIRSRASLFALLLSCALAFLSPASMARRTLATAYDINGHWIGKFPIPEDSKISDADNPVAIEVSVKDDAGKLSGSAAFYVIRNKDNKPQVMGKTEAELIDPQFDGATLKFSVKSRAPQSGKESKIDMRMKLTSNTEAELENLEDSSAPTFKMVKVSVMPSAAEGVN